MRSSRSSGKPSSSFKCGDLGSRSRLKTRGSGYGRMPFDWSRFWIFGRVGGQATIGFSGIPGIDQMSCYREAA